MDYDHCPCCGWYQQLEPISVSDGDSIEFIGVGDCWLCGELFYVVLARFSKDVVM